MLDRLQRRIVGCLTLVAWLGALACASAYACDLGAPAPQDDCCDCCATSTSIDAQCSTHCAFEGQAPTVGWPDVAQPALAAPMLQVVAPAPVVRTHPPPDLRGASPPLTILLLRLRN